PRPVEIIRREEFDRSLLEQVGALGVEVRQACALRAVEVAGGTATATTDAGTVRAKVVVGADGAGSVVGRRLGMRARRRIRLFRAEVPAPPRYRDGETMVYDFSAMRPGPDTGLRGYLWIFPVPGDRLNVGLMHDPGSPRSGAQLAELLDR